MEPCQNFKTRIQCLEVMNLVGMLWKVSSMEIVVDGPWSNGLLPFCSHCTCDLFILVTDYCLLFALA